MDDNKAPEAAKKRLPYQDQISIFYNGVQIQVLVAGLIGANFLTNMVEKQIDPGGNRHVDAFAGLDLFYNIAFTVELAVNMYAHWFCDFWRSNWNLFDTVVVSIGIINLLKLPLPPAFNLLRLMRAFRVFRLFKRVKSLNKIIVSIVHAVPGVMNALLILLIVMCIYAILAVELFMDVGQGCKSSDYEFANMGFGPSIRGFCIGDEYFGSFTKSLYTFFQVLTGESWAEMVARPVIWFYEDEAFLAVAAAMFFVSFCLVTGFVLLNVVVAVLLDKMSSGGDDESEAAGPCSEGSEGSEEVADAAQAPLTVQERKVYRHFHQVAKSLETVTAQQMQTQTEFDRTRADMIDMKEQLGKLSKVFSEMYDQGKI